MNQNLDSNIILFDWLTFSAKNMTVEDMQKFLGMDHVTWDECSGKNFYRSGYFFHGVSIWYDGIRNNMGICVNMSGSGCRAFETHGSGDWSFLISSIIGDPFKYNISRLDIAYDDHTGVLDIDELRSDVDDGYFTCRSKQYQVVYGTLGTTLYFGSEKSDIMCRIYDKASERGLSDQHWIRVELQLRRDRAIHFASHVFSSGFQIGNVFSGVLIGYLTFRSPTDDSNKSRWPLADYWLLLLGDVESIPYFVSVEEEYNAGKLKRIVDTMYGNGIYTFVSLYGISGLVRSLYSHGRKLNDNYKKLIRDCPDQQRDLFNTELLDVLDFLGLKEVLL